MIPNHRIVEKLINNREVCEQLQVCRK